MIMPLILNVVIVSTKHLLHVYHCQQSILVFIKSSIQSPDSFKVQVVQVTIENLLVLGWIRRAHCWFWDRPKRLIRAPKGHSALWKMTRVDND